MPLDTRLQRSELAEQGELPTRQFGRVVQVRDPKSPPCRRREHLAVQAPVARERSRTRRSARRALDMQPARRRREPLRCSSRASASAPGSPGVTRRPASRPSRASGSPPTRLATTGVPAASDSSTTSPNPSRASDGTTERSAARYNAVNRVRSDSPEEPHRLAETQPVGLSLELIPERSFADHEEAHRSRLVAANELRPRFEQDVVAHPRHEASDRDHHVLVTEAESGAVRCCDPRD